MSWKCENCGQKLSGKEIFCPNCVTKVIYRCVRCEKELDNGKHKYCPVCNTKRTEERNEKLIRFGGAAAGFLAVAMVIGKKFGGRKS